jgi:ribosomal protein S6--L-glutamate ligase
MKTFLILTSDVSSESNHRIKTEIENLGHKAEIKNPMNFVAVLSETTGHDRLIFRDETTGKTERLIAKNYAGVVVRIGGSVFDYAMFIVRQFENLGIFVSCPAFAAENCSNKFRTSQILSRAKVPVPKQALSWDAQNPGEIIAMVDKKLPVWAKQVRGSKGIGVFQLVEAVSANQIMESFRSIALVIQRDVNQHKTLKRSDIRVLIVGAETEKPELVAYERISETADQRSNFSIHKSGKPIELNGIERQDCIKAAKALGCGVAGIDLIRDEQPGSKSQGTTLCIEVNQNLGLTGIEEVTRKNCAGLIAQYVVEQSGRKRPNAPFYDNAAFAFDHTPQPSTKVDSLQFRQRYPNLAKVLNLKR